MRNNDKSWVWLFLKYLSQFIRNILNTSNMSCIHLTLITTVQCVSKNEMSSTLSQIVSHLSFDNNFGKCGPVFRILLPTDS